LAILVIDDLNEYFRTIVQYNSVQAVYLRGKYNMNKQYKGNGRRGIEWTDYTWNPVGGCQHGCRWKMPDGTIAECYAETVAERVAQNTYNQGFEHHYWNPHVLPEPLKLKKSARIFIDSMSDLMGQWVADEQIQQVLDICGEATWHSFQLLTKNAPRLRQFTFPENIWVGVSAPPTIMFGKRLSLAQQVRMLQTMLNVLRDVDVPIKWMSLEPLSFDIAQLLVGSNLRWAVIGAATNGPKMYQPRPEWVSNVLKVLDKQGTRVFFKGNLDWSPWREDFPIIVAEEEQQLQSL
jgi:protein gp37